MTMQITLTVTAGVHTGKVFTFSGHDTFIVGRSVKAHFALAEKDGYFSRIHFMVEVNPPSCRLMDMDSRNGTRVNGERVQVVDLKHGDEIRAGRTKLRVSMEELPPVYDQETVARTAAAAIPLQQAMAVVRSATNPGRSSQVLQLETPRKAAPHSPIQRCPACMTPVEATGLCSACLQLSAKAPQPVAGYRVIRMIGKGGMGEVFLAIREADGCALALKTITPAVEPNDVAFQRFLREADILRELSHPRIVSYRDSGESNGQLYFAMDYVAGIDAFRLVAREGPQAIGRAIGIAGQLLEALQYAHSKGFVHRDIKPANVLVATVDGVDDVKLADFGLARTYQASQLSGLTVMGAIGGTVAYMPPEQILNFRAVKPSADQYSAAATLYYLLTGKPIFDLPKTAQQQLLIVMQKEPIPVQQRRPEIPTPLATAIHTALARDPKKRFADVAAFRAALLQHV